MMVQPLETENCDNLCVVTDVGRHCCVSVPRPHLIVLPLQA